MANRTGKLITIAEVAERQLLPFSVRSLRALIANGRMKAGNIGLGKVPRWAVTEAEIERIKSSLVLK